MGRKPLLDSFKFLFLFTTQGFSSISKQYPSLFPNFSKGVVFLMFKKVIKYVLQPVCKICCNIARISWKFRFLIKCLFNLSLIHISEPTRLGMISYAVFCLKKK